MECGGRDGGYGDAMMKKDEDGEQMNFFDGSAIGCLLTGATET